MVTALEFNSEYELGVSNTGKFFIDKENGVAESIKNVPVVIYNNIYNLEYIKSNMDKFKYSCHIAFIDLKTIQWNIIRKMNSMGIAVFLRIDINEIDGSIGIDLRVDDFPTEYSLYFDRYVLVDNTKSMTFEKLMELKGIVAQTFRIPVEEVGVCGSPFSFGDSACLCATWARRVMAKYVSNTEVALPSAHHECMEECGCIRKIAINNNICAPTSNKKSVSSGSKIKEVKGVSNIRGLF